MIYLAPMQGLTDYVFRRVFSRHFGGVDSYFIPYISLKGGEIPARELRDILPDNNLGIPVVPQVLPANAVEFIRLSEILAAHGYRKININMGCPYPMVTRRGRGAGLLSFPQKIEEILDAAFSTTGNDISVKMRMGIEDEKEMYGVFEILNRYPLKEIIFHPRAASQLYKGTARTEKFAEAQQLTHLPLVYNGDIFSLNDFEAKKQLLGGINRWMVGRGLLMNPFLADEMTGEIAAPESKKQRLIDFHEDLTEVYLSELATPGNMIDKMRLFWSYFCHNFPESQKAFKRIKKAHTIHAFRLAVAANFRSY